MIKGRKEALGALRRVRKDGDEWVMIHAASVGEFEQARPVIEWLKNKYPSLKICLTFFSPSGYNTMKNYPLADLVTYLPFDNSRQLPTFIDLLAPKFVLIIKYEFWLRTIGLLHRRQIPVFLVSAIFRESQPFFRKRSGSIFRDALRKFHTLFIQNESSARLLDRIDIRNYIITGDTRMDRVEQIKENGKKLLDIEALRSLKIAQDKKVLVAGSTWPPDEVNLLRFLDDEKRLFPIIVPHEIDESHIRQIIQSTPIKVTRYSQWDGTNAEEIELLLIDKMGLLSTLYRYADIAYVGGGFGRGIHNTLEAAVYGIPVLFGPNCRKFQEAKSLIDSGGGFKISTYADLADKLNELLSYPDVLHKSGKSARSVVTQSQGATLIITETIDKEIILKS